MKAVESSPDASGIRVAGAEVENRLDIDELAEAVIDGGDAAWPELVALVHPMALRLCRATSEELRHEVASLVIERLQNHEYRALRRYLETRENNPGLAFTSWLRVVVRNTRIDCERAQPDSQRVREQGGRVHRKIAMESLGVELQSEGDLRRDVEVQRILSWLRDPSFPEIQRRALLLWLRGCDATEIAADLNLDDSKVATKLLRAARQRLRREVQP